MHRAHLLCVAQDDRVINKKTAWALKGDLAKCDTIFVRGKRFTTIAAISFGGVLCHRTVEGGATMEIFEDFFLNDVVSCVCAGFKHLLLK